jgi:hypothetical protein
MAAAGRTGRRDATPLGPEEKRYLYVLFSVYLALLGIATAVVLWSVYADDGPGPAASVVGGLLALVPVMVAVGQRNDRVEVVRNWKVFLGALVTALLLGAAAVVWMSSRSEDVTTHSVLRNAEAMADGSVARLTVNAEPGGDELKLRLGAEDKADGFHTSCLPLASLHFSGADLADESDVNLDNEVSATLPLRGGGPRVRVDVTLNTSGDEGCRVRLTLKGAELP